MAVLTSVCLRKAVASGTSASETNLGQNERVSFNLNLLCAVSAA